MEVRCLSRTREVSGMVAGLGQVSMHWKIVPRVQDQQSFAQESTWKFSTAQYAVDSEFVTANGTSPRVQHSLVLGHLVYGLCTKSPSTLRLRHDAVKKTVVCALAACRPQGRKPYVCQLRRGDHDRR
eukprot:6191055-Pleurochrysis_carterae.AAC.1